MKGKSFLRILNFYVMSLLRISGKANIVDLCVSVCEMSISAVKASVEVI